jgi:hypothetical protein
MRIVFMVRLSLHVVRAIVARIGPMLLAILALSATGGGDFPVF